MDNPAANKNHIPCPPWLDQSSWSTASAQELCMNLQASSQNLRAGSTSAQRPLFGHSETTNQNCMSGVTSLSSRNNSLLKAPNLNMFSPNSIFHNPVSTASSQNMSFVPQTSYTSSGLAATDQGKTIPPPALSQQHQDQPCRVQNLPSQPANYKMFQTHGLQNQLFGLSSCGPNVNMSRATFGGQNTHSRFPNTFNSATSMEQHQLVPSSSSGAVPDDSGHANKATSQEKGLSSSTEGDKRRSSILSQRAELLKQLERINKLLETMPSDDNNEEEPSNNDLQDETQEAEKEMDKGHSEDDMDNNSDYVPQSEVSFSDSLSDEDTDSKDRPTKDMEKKFNYFSSEEENDSSPKRFFEEKKRKSKKVEIEKKEEHTSTKRNYCLFCGRGMTKMSRHLTGAHSDRPEVAIVFQYPTNSTERRRMWQKLINEGNFKHNKDVFKKGKGKLAVRVRPTNPQKAINFVHCLHCHGLYRKKSLHVHMKRCKEKAKKEDKSQEVRKRIISQCALLTKNCDGLSEEFKALLGEMVYDDVSEALMDDQILLQFGEQMFNEYTDSKTHDYVRQNLRNVARLLIEAQKSTPMATLEDFFKPSNFKHVVSSVRVVAGYDPEKKRYARASLALKLGYHLKKICDIVQRNAQNDGDTKIEEFCKIFLSTYHKKWTKCITSCALSNMKDTKKEGANKVPNVQDVKRVYYHLETVHHAAEKKLRENSCPENFAALAKVVLARTILFNRRFPGEVASITMAAFKSRIRSDVCNDMDVSVSEMERKLCGLFSRINIKGKCGRVVPIILKPSFESSIELLIDVREACGIFSKNPYVFPRQFALTCLRGSDCIHNHAKECGVEDPAAFTVLKLRRHFATVLQLLNLDSDEVKQILGPGSDIQVLREINNTMCDDSIMESTGPLQFYQQRTGAAGCSMPGRGLQTKSKLGWSEAEVQAVERHLKTFIKKQILPQKDDCIRCLEAEPLVLEKRSWKGVKDFVRNRITTLQRRAGSFKKPSKSSTEKDKPQQSSATSQPPNGEKEPRETISTGSSSGSVSGTGSASTTPQKGKGSDLRHKPKPKWGEAEVHAVEKHLMHFIEQHKLPHKDDCTRCLDAEPHALKNRSWKGVKDYVRNRITALQRQSGFSKDLSQTKSQPRKEKSQRSTNSLLEGVQLSSAQPVPEYQNVFSSCSYGSSNFFQPQTYAEITSYNMTPPAPPMSGRTKEKASTGLPKKSKHTWNEEEVQAVERHLMNFIIKQKLPQKNDCVQCINAEPHALMNRSWKGVKDYVRNRITTLQRQSGFSRTASKNNRSKQDRPQQSARCYQQL